MLGVNDLFRVTLKYRYGGTGGQLRSQRWYEQTTNFPQSTNLAVIGEAFWLKIQDAVRNVTTTLMLYDTVEVEQMTGAAVGLINEFAINGGVGLTGAVGGDTLPPHDVLTVKIFRPSNLFRHNYFALSGVPEGGQSNGVLTIVPATLQALIDAFAQDFAVAGGNIYSPRVVRREIGGIPLQFPQFAAPSDVDILPRIGTRSSRKLGVGQ